MKQAQNCGSANPGGFLGALLAAIGHRPQVRR